MNAINILGVSHLKHEPHNFYLLRENGLPAFHFVHFVLPAIVTINDVKHITGSNACIIYSPNYRQEYGCYGDNFLNDFITFQIDDPDFVARYELPENEIFYISTGEEITAILELMTFAATDKTEPRDQEIEDLLFRLFKALSKLHIDSNPNFKRIYETKQRFIKLRDSMRKDPQHWNVDTMAKRVWLTRSRFSVLYNDFFGISPVADLINIKIHHAKKLLETTRLSVKEISGMCGYSNVGYFIRLFSNHVHSTPLQYRKSYHNKN